MLFATSGQQIQTKQLLHTSLSGTIFMDLRRVQDGVLTELDNRLWKLDVTNTLPMLPFTSAPNLATFFKTNSWTPKKNGVSLLRILYLPLFCPWYCIDGFLRHFRWTRDTKSIEFVENKLPTSNLFVETGRLSAYNWCSSKLPWCHFGWLNIQEFNL